MKKILLCAAVAAVISSAASAQVMSEKGMKNTAWTGFGSPLNADTMFYGFTDTFQARFDVGNFTIEGMLNWSFLANYDNEGDVDNFVFGTSNANPLTLHYGTRGGTAYAGDNEVSAALGYNDQVNVSNVIQDSYYVNFIWHPLRNFDFGVGTKLNWKVGPAPSYGGWLWESTAHVRQGGFSTSYDDRSGSRAQTSSETANSYKYSVDAPGSGDVVGFVHYANKYAKRAMGVRYFYEGDFTFQLGAAIPNGFNTDDPAVNFGIEIAPVDWLCLSAAYEGAFDDHGNFYTGVTLGQKNFILEGYFAADSLNTDEEDDQAYGTGAAITFVIPNTEISLRPEFGLNFFENDNYTFAWYTGALLSLKINRDFGLSVWGSFANGSDDKTWEDDDVTKDWDGGHVINVRPAVDIAFDAHTSFTVYLNLEERTAFDGVSRGCWSSGVYVTYLF